ncbi:cytochrome P450 4c21-like [Brevipalpus obovatus]|uniref:cytochrome P450 4c21-like n=1 Tax=Brevipalpus obovatus TaxID=246614 RepID=UPI003D9EC23F
MEKILRNSKILDRGWFIKVLTQGRKNLISLAGQEWKTRRRLVAPSFDNSILKTKFVPTIVDRTIDLCQRLEGIDGQPIRDIIGEHVLSIVLETTLGLVDVDLKKIEMIHRKTRDWVISLGKIPSKPQLLIDLLFQMIAEFFNHPSDSKIINDYVKEIIEQRSAERYSSNNNSDTIVSNGKTRLAFLDHMIHHLIESGDNKSAKLSAQDLVDETMSVIINGFDTVTSTITYVLYNLAKDPVIQEKFYQERRREMHLLLCQSNDSEIEIGKLDCYPLLTQCIKESLRLQCTTSGTSRTSKDSIEIGGYVIPKNAFITVRIHTIHHDDNVFPVPEKFDPSRFSTENMAKIPPGAFVPFGDGPRRCLGERLALLEMHIILGRILSKFQVNLIDNEKTMVKYTLINSIFNQQPKFKFVNRDL